MKWVFITLTNIFSGLKPWQPSDLVTLTHLEAPARHWPVECVCSLGVSPVDSFPALKE